MPGDRDFYAILGIPKTADAAAIKAAYRKLARTYHPDVNKSADAQAKFTEIQEAYDVLSDEEKRRLYDRVGHAAFRAHGSAAGGPAGGWAGGGPRPGGPGGMGGQPIDFDEFGSIFDAFFGGRAGASPGGGMGGMGGGRTAGRSRRARARGRDIRSEISIDLITASRGGSRTVKLERDGERREIKVTIPAGIADGATLRMRGEGGGGEGQVRGDLLLTVKITPHPVLKRGKPGATDASSLDLWLEVPLRLDEALLGARVDVPTPDGAVGLTIPPGTSSGVRLRIRGKGMDGPGGKKGDLYALAKVVLPAEPPKDADQIGVIRAIGSGQPNPRSGAGWA